MTRLRGWAPRGQRLVDKVPQGKWKTATFLAALRNDQFEQPVSLGFGVPGDTLRFVLDDVGQDRISRRRDRKAPQDRSGTLAPAGGD